MRIHDMNGLELERDDSVSILIDTDISHDTAIKNMRLNYGVKYSIDIWY